MCGGLIKDIGDVAVDILVDPLVDVAKDVVMDVTGQSAVLEQQRANADAQAQAILASSLAAAQAAQAQAGAAAASINTQLRQEEIAQQAADKLGVLEQGPTVTQGADVVQKKVLRRQAKFRIGPSV